jgi:hypothetical protein
MRKDEPNLSSVQAMIERMDIRGELMNVDEAIPWRPQKICMPRKLLRAPLSSLRDNQSFGDRSVPWGSAESPACSMMASSPRVAQGDGRREDRPK